MRGALASALASMVGNLTVGKKKYADVEERMRAELVELDDTRAPAVAHRRGRSRLRTPLPLTGCPKDTDAESAAQNAALQKALVGACEVPRDHGLLPAGHRVLRGPARLGAGSRMPGRAPCSPKQRLWRRA